jgi:hypothetical protein
MTLLTKRIVSCTINVACVVSTTIAMDVQSGPLLLVSPQEQANRDAARNQILDAELRDETAAVIKVTQRVQERARVGDQIGLSEAQESLRLHQANVLALHREIEHFASPSIVMATHQARRGRQIGRQVSHSAKSGVATNALTSGDTQRWDMYKPHRTWRQNSEFLSSTQSASSPGLSAAPAPTWDLYRKVTLTDTNSPGVAPQPEPREDYLADATAVPYLVYRDPNAVTSTRNPETSNDKRN